MTKWHCLDEKTIMRNTNCTSNDNISLLTFQRFWWIFITLCWEMFSSPRDTILFTPTNCVYDLTKIFSYIQSSNIWNHFGKSICNLVTLSYINSKYQRYLLVCTLKLLINIMFYYKCYVLPSPQKFNLFNARQQNSFMMICDINEKIFRIHSKHFVMGKQSLNSSSRHQNHTLI